MSFAEFLVALRDSRPPAVENAVILARVDSTNLLAKRIVGDYLREELEPPRHVLLAWTQTLGRGRLGRTWSSPPGKGVYASIVLPADDAATVARLPFVAAVALAETLRATTGVACRVKWPNDLLVDGRKLGGVLIETVARGDSLAAAVVGFGINREHDRDELPPHGTSLRLEGVAAPPIATLGWALVSAVLARLDSDAPLGELMETYRQLSIHRPGDRLVCQLGDERVEGRFLGFDEQGHLRLATASGERRVGAGEVIAS